MAVDEETRVFVGQKMLIEVEYRLNGVPTDPTLASVSWRAPGGTQATLSYPTTDFVRRSAGLYEASILVAEAGTWIFRTEAAGIVDAVNEMSQEVLASGLSG